MKRCMHQGCRGQLFADTTDNVWIGSTRVTRTQFVCSFCAKVTTDGPAVAPMKRVHAGRFLPVGGRR